MASKAVGEKDHILCAEARLAECLIARTQRGASSPSRFDLGSPGGR